MGNNEAEKPVKSEKSVPPAAPPQEQSKVHVYPDWATVQAYYGPGAMPPSYYNPAVTSGRAPHPYMWPPPQMLPPYSSPYAAMYPHGGIYGHTPAPFVATPLNLERSTSENDGGSAKKLRDSDAATASGNGHAESRGNLGQSRSTDCGTEDSCDRSDDSTAQENQNGKNRTNNGIADAGNKIASGTKSAGSTPTSALEASDSSGAKMNANTVNAVTSVASRPFGASVQNEREIKREKRKQSNRESARRSRLRKQAEMDELAKKVDLLNVENMALKAELSKLVENSEMLRSENASIMEKLKSMQGPESKVNPEGTDNQEKLEVNTENLLSRVDNGCSNEGHEE